MEKNETGENEEYNDENKVCNADERGDSMCKMREVECIDDTNDKW